MIINDLKYMEIAAEESTVVGSYSIALIYQQAISIARAYYSMGYAIAHARSQNEAIITGADRFGIYSQAISIASSNSPNPYSVVL